MQRSSDTPESKENLCLLSWTPKRTGTFRVRYLILLELNFSSASTNWIFPSSLVASKSLSNPMVPMPTCSAVVAPKMSRLSPFDNCSSVTPASFWRRNPFFVGTPSALCPMMPSRSVMLPTQNAGICGSNNLGVFECVGHMTYARMTWPVSKKARDGTLSMPLSRIDASCAFIPASFCAVDVIVASANTRVVKYFFIAV